MSGYRTNEIKRKKKKKIILNMKQFVYEELEALSTPNYCVCVFSYLSCGWGTGYESWMDGGPPACTEVGLPCD